ncbi:DUF938 domain-containing protein [Pseudenhygromyxa sp. WMMC2535]|uniref:DUF938 domain-containing protein n=1 Tax=Pseudenhygromyxa sp. WMMC2535 TaxID=2712867 RepID=UPI0031F756BB
MSEDPRLDYPATNRNREPILAQLRALLPASGVLLEIASGSGQHAAHFARALPKLRWQPTDIDAAVFPSIRAWNEDLDNVQAPLHLDTTHDPWPVERCDAIFCANMIHIAPWEACLGLLDGSARVLEQGGVLILYGPFMREGAHTAPSNAAFDERLRARDPRWGVRDLDHLTELAATKGLHLDHVADMPANNLTVRFTRTSGHVATHVAKGRN